MKMDILNAKPGYLVLLIWVCLTIGVAHAEPPVPSSQGKADKTAKVIEEVKKKLEARLIQEHQSEELAEQVKQLEAKLTATESSLTQERSQRIKIQETSHAALAAASQKIEEIRQKQDKELLQIKEENQSLRTAASHLKDRILVLEKALSKKEQQSRTDQNSRNKERKHDERNKKVEIGLKHQLRDLKKKLERQDATVENYARKLSESGKQAKQLGKKIARLNKSLAKKDKEYISERRAHQDTKQAWKESSTVLQKEINRLGSMVEDGKEKNHRVERRLRRLESDHASGREALKKSESELEKVRQNYKTEVEELKRTHASLSRKDEANHVELKKLRAVNESLVTETAKLSRLLDQAKEDLTQARNALPKAQNRSSEHAKLHSNLKIQEQTIRDQGAKLSQVKEALRASQASAARLEKELEKAVRSFHAKEKEAKKLEETVRTQQDRFDREHAAIKEQHTRSSATVVSLRAELDKLLVTLDGMKKELSTAHSALQQTRKRSQESESKHVSRLKKELKQAHKKLAKEQQQREKDQAESKVEITALRESASTLRQQLSRAKEAFRKSEEQIAQYKEGKEKQGLIKLQADNRVLRGKIAKKDELLEKARARAVAMEKEVASAKTEAHERTAEWQKSIDSWEKRVSDLNVQLKQAEEKRAKDLARAKRASAGEQDELSAHLSTLKEENQKLVLAHAKAKETTNFLRSDLKLREAELDQSKKKIAALEAESNKRRKELERALKESAESLAQKAESYRAERNQLKTEILHLKDILKKEEETGKRISHQLEAYKKMDKHQPEQGSAIYKEELERVQTALDTALREADVLRKELERVGQNRIQTVDDPGGRLVKRGAFSSTSDRSWRKPSSRSTSPRSPNKSYARAKRVRIGRDLSENMLTKKIDRGNERLREGDVEEAEKLFESVLTSEPGNAEARLGLASCSYAKNKLVTSKNDVVSLLRDDPQNARAWGLGGLIAWREGALGTAKKMLDRGLKADPTDPQLYNYMAIILHAQKEDAQALEKLRKAVDLDPHYAEALINLSILLATLDAPKLAEAKRYYDIALDQGVERDYQLENLLYR